MAPLPDRTVPSAFAPKKVMRSAGSTPGASATANPVWSNQFGSTYFCSVAGTDIRACQETEYNGAQENNDPRLVEQGRGKLYWDGKPRLASPYIVTNSFHSYERCMVERSCANNLAERAFEGRSHVHAVLQRSCGGSTNEVPAAQAVKAVLFSVFHDVCCFCCCLCCCCFSLRWAWDPNLPLFAQYKVIGRDFATVRSGESLNSDIKTVLTLGTIVEVTEVKGR